jgi:hypothetical protein
MTMRRRTQTMAVLPVMACAVLLLALAAPAAAQSEACVHLQVGSGYTAIMGVTYQAEAGDLVADVEAHLQLNGPWPYKLSQLYYEPAVTAAVEKMAAEHYLKIAARVYQSPVD